MKHGEKTVVCLLCGLVVWGEAKAALAVSSENPYQAVVERNVFGLKPPAPPPPDPASIKPPAPKVLLNGIITLLGNKRALLKMTPPGSKPGEAAKEQPFTLAEGQREGDLEVIKIDESAGIVTVNDFGTITNITFDTNANRTASAPGPAPTPAGVTPPPNMPAGFTPPGGGLRQIPTRTLRLPGMGGLASPGATGTTGGEGASMPGFGSVNPALAQNQQSATPQMSREEQEIMAEANYQIAKAKNDASAALFPPSALDPTRNIAPQPGTQSAETGNTQSGNTQTGNTQLPPMPGRPRLPF